MFLKLDKTVDFIKTFYSCQMADEMYSEFLAENKKTRVPGEPRHFIDCYLDELDKVCVFSCLNSIQSSGYET